MDIVERLRSENCMFGYYESPEIQIEAANEIERLRNNAKQDAKYLLAYHLICQKHGIAPSSSDLLEALGEKE
jgi:hypothetical protein